MTSYVLCKTGSLAVFKVTARDQGHYKGPSGAFVTYCNISCFVFFFDFLQHEGMLYFLIRGDSNEYTEHTIISTKKRKSPKIIPNKIMSAAMGFFLIDSRPSSK